MKSGAAEKGFTLIEVLAALALFALVGSGLFAAYYMGNNAFKQESSQSDLQYNARKAMEDITYYAVQANPPLLTISGTNNNILSFEIDTQKVAYELAGNWLERKGPAPGSPQPVVEKIAEIEYTRLNDKTIIVRVKAADGSNSYELTHLVMPRAGNEKNAGIDPPGSHNIGKPGYIDGYSGDDAPVIANAEGGKLYTSKDDGKTWQLQDPNLFDLWGVKEVDINQLVVNGKTIVLVGEGVAEGRVAVSIDGGATWKDSLSLRTILSGIVIKEYNSIAYGNGTYVAVAASQIGRGRIAYSKDAVNWFLAESGPYETLWADYPFNSVFYGDKKFIAVGMNGELYYSADGENWKEGSTGTKKDLYSIVYNSMGGKYVAVGEGGTIITSVDGNKNWTAQKSNTTKKLNSVTWGTDQYIAVGNNGTILASKNGEKWVPIPLNDTAVELADKSIFVFQPAKAAFTGISCVYGRYVITVDPATTNNVKLVVQSADNGLTWQIQQVN